MNHRRFLSQIVLIVGVLLFSAGLQTFAAFTAPATAPPGADAYAPLHTGSDAQSKVGGLLLNTGGATNGLIVQFGNVGIGTTNPSQRLEINGNVQISGTIRGASYGFGGMYTILGDQVSCGYPNPITGGCSCPSGFTTSPPNYTVATLVTYFCYK